MPAGWAAAAVAGATVVSGVLSSNASRDAANTQAGAADRATAAQGVALERQIELNKPFYDVGVNAVNNLSSQKAYTPTAFNYSADPGYAFRLKEGMNAMNATAAARGGLISGNALKAGQAYGQDMGSQEYQNAYSRYLTNNAQSLQAYNTNTANNQFLANLGQSSANNQANAIGNFGNSAAANTIGAGNALAAGSVGSANAYSNAVGQGIGQYNFNSMLNRFAPQSQSAYSTNGMGQLQPGGNFSGSGDFTVSS